MPEAVIIDCLRTPVGKAPRGALRTTRPDDLGAIVIRSLLEKYPAAKDAVEDVILGCAMPEGEAGSNMARQSALRAGLPDSVPAMTINRFCSSGLQAIALAAERLQAKYGVSREDADAFALRSHQNAVSAQNEGRFSEEIVPVPLQNVT